MRAIYLLILFVFLSGCISTQEKEVENKNKVHNEIDPGSLKINYYSNKSVTPLEIPPDLTSPNYQKSFRLSEYTDRKINESIVNFTNKALPQEAILESNNNIEVKKSGNIRWLQVKKSPDEVWNLVKQFFKEEGFIIKKSNKKIGIMETDYLENKPEIPAQSVGLIRSMLQKALKARYSLPIIDKYRVRVEPEDGTKSTNVFLSISSMQEVITNSGREDENTTWQPREKDVALEVEMLYKLMLFFGGDKVISREKILQAKEESSIEIDLKTSFNGYSILVFNSNFLDAWDSFSWALDQLDIDIEDKDILEKSIYINSARTSDLGFFTTIFGDEAVKKTFKLTFKEGNNLNTEVYFTDLSGENETETKEFSMDFFTNIKKQFK